MLHSSSQHGTDNCHEYSSVHVCGVCCSGVLDTGGTHNYRLLVFIELVLAEGLAWHEISEEHGVSVIVGGVVWLRACKQTIDSPIEINTS